MDVTDSQKHFAYTMCIQLEKTLYPKAGFLDGVYSITKPQKPTLDTTRKVTKVLLIHRALYNVYLTFNPHEYKMGQIYKKTWAEYRRIDARWREKKIRDSVVHPIVPPRAPPVAVPPVAVPRVDPRVKTRRVKTRWVSMDTLKAVLTASYLKEELDISVLHSALPDDEYQLYDYCEFPAMLGVCPSHKVCWLDYEGLIYLKITHPKEGSLVLKLE